MFNFFEPPKLPNKKLFMLRKPTQIFNIDDPDKHFFLSGVMHDDRMMKIRHTPKMVGGVLVE